MRRRGFTLVELATVMSCFAVLVPLVFLLARSVEEQRARGLWTLEVAEATRTVADELSLDLRTGAFVDGSTLALAGVAGCGGEVRFALTAEHVLVREAPAACGGPRALARDVASARRVPHGVELVFEYSPRPGKTERERVVVPVGG